METPAYTATLNDLINKRESEREPQEIEQIVALLREQREKWSAVQAAGKRTLVKSKDISTTPKGSFKKKFAGLKL